MNNKVNYKLVGLSVVFGLFMMLAFVYWLMKPSADAQMQKYLIYFDESVSGLNVNAPVKYRGISVGKIIDLRINPKNSEQVQATVDILKITPIKETTVAKLTAQGITGLTYINLSLGANNSPPLKIKKGEEYPVIKSVPSLFKDVEKSLGTLSTQFTDTLDKTNELLNDTNQKEIRKILNKTANILSSVDKLLNDKTIIHLQRSAKNLDDFSMRLTALTPKIDTFISNSITWEDKMSDSFIDIKKTYSSMGVTMINMAESFADGQKDLNGMALNIVPSINETMLSIQSSLLEFNELMQEYKRSPNDILFKKEAIKRGPGEK
jgi:phospholipid/cholesterol/gamma-HCH transport system substrate-binding protein